MKKTIYINGNIITDKPKEEIKEAIMVRNGIIEAVGSNE